MPQDPDVEQIVRDFFASDRAISMELPDGWFGGRPYDNQHELTFIAMRPHKLILELDGEVYLIFTSPECGRSPSSPHRKTRKSRSLE